MYYFSLFSENYWLAILPTPSKNISSKTKLSQTPPPKKA
jgi:hypothetical protein